MALSDIQKKIEHVIDENVIYHRKVDKLETNSEHIREKVVKIEEDVSSMKGTMQTMSGNIIKLTTSWTQAWTGNGAEGAATTIRKNKAFRYQAQGAIALVSFVSVGVLVKLFIL